MLRRRGVTTEFANNYRDEFVIYWSSTSKQRSEWDSVFLSQTVEQFEKRKGKSKPVNKSIAKEIALDVVKAWNNAVPEHKEVPVNYTASQLSTQIGWLWNAQPENLQDPEFFEAVFSEMSNDEFLMKETTAFTLANAIRQDRFATSAARIVKDAA